MSGRFQTCRHGRLRNIIKSAFSHHVPATAVRGTARSAKAMLRWASMMSPGDSDANGSRFDASLIAAPRLGLASRRRLRRAITLRPEDRGIPIADAAEPACGVEA